MKGRVLAVAIVFIAAASIGPSVGAKTPHHAGIVVQHSNGTQLVHCVKFTQDEISGYKLLQKSKFKYKAATFNSEEFGRSHGVCWIDGEGVHTGKPGECFSDPSGNFWGYYTQESGLDTPTSSDVGADDRVVTDGDVDYWIWGQYGGAPPDPVTFAQACPDLAG